MDNAQIETWARTFTGDLLIAGTSVPIDRVLHSHLETIKALRTRGITWAGLSVILTRGGARRADGGVISAGQLRAAVSRLSRRSSDEVLRPTPSAENSEPAAPSAASSSRLAPEKRRRPIRPSSPPPSEAANYIADPITAKDLTDDDIAAALHRIGRRLA